MDSASYLNTFNYLKVFLTTHAVAYSSTLLKTFLDVFTI